jgi:hypothetical protein
MTVRCKNNLCELQTARRLAAHRLVPGPLKLLLHCARILLDREGHLPRASRGRPDQRLQLRLHLEPLDPAQRPELASRLGALATMPHHRFVERLRPCEEPDHRKDPGFARPITLAKTSSFGICVLCEYFARFSFSRLGGARAKSAATCETPTTRGNSWGQLTRPAREVMGRSRWCRDRTPGSSRPWQPVRAAVLRRAEECDANRTSGRISLRAGHRKSYRSREQI